MALAEHTGIYKESIGHIVGNALSDIAEDGKHYEHLKQNPDLIVDVIQLQLEKLGYRYDREKLREMVRTAVEKAGKIVDKLYDKYQEDHLKAFRTALKADNPFPVLKQAGIDIEPELEEFRQFLAEISGKKVKPKSKEEQEEPGKTKLLEDSKLEVLSILQALEFADYLEQAKRKAIEKLSSKTDELSREKLTLENLQRLGLYTFTIELIKRNEFNRAKEIKEL